MIAIGGDDKKKIMVAGGGGVVLLLILVVVFVHPFGGGNADSGTDTAATATSPRPGAVPGAPNVPGSPGRPPGSAPDAASGGAPQPADAGAPASAAAPAADGTAQPILLISATRYRPDPFKPFYTPTLPPPKAIPGALSIPSPVQVSTMPLNLPPEFGSETGSSPALIQLPPINTPQMRLRSAPSAVPPPQILPDTSVPLRSPNKRLSGVILGDSIYALVEMGEGEEAVTRVVQPGDEVDGIKILRIERIDDNGEQRTRMTVEENGQQRFFDLQPAPQVAAGGAGGIGGAVGGPAIRPRPGPPLP